MAHAFENEGVGHPASGDRVVLTIPSKPQYVGLCRLALAALATRDLLSEDVVADLKIAVSEACALFVPLADEVERQRGSRRSGEQPALGRDPQPT